MTAEGEGGTVSKGPVMDEPTGKEQTEGSHAEGFISGGEGGGTSWRPEPLRASSRPLWYPHAILALGR